MVVTESGGGGRLGIVIRYACARACACACAEATTRNRHVVSRLVRVKSSWQFQRHDGGGGGGGGEQCVVVSPTS